MVALFIMSQTYSIRQKNHSAHDCFHNFQMLILNKLDHKYIYKYTEDCNKSIFSSISVDGAFEASLAGVPFKAPSDENPELSKVPC